MVFGLILIDQLGHSPFNEVVLYQFVVRLAVVLVADAFIRCSLIGNRFNLFRVSDRALLGHFALSVGSIALGDLLYFFGKFS